MHTGNEKKLKEAKGQKCSKLLIFSYERSNFFPFLLNIKLSAIWLKDLSTNFKKETHLK